VDLMQIDRGTLRLRHDHTPERRADLSHQDSRLMRGGFRNQTVLVQIHHGSPRSFRMARAHPRGDGRFLMNPQNWMASVPDDTYLSLLSIPGTHDTLTYSATLAGEDQLRHSTPASAVPYPEAVSHNLHCSLVFKKARLMVYLSCNSKISFLTGFTDGKMYF